MERLHNLERLIKELRGQLESAQAVAKPPDRDLHAASTPGSHGLGRNFVREEESSPREGHSDPNSPFGRLVLQDGASDSHYVGTGFWSRVVDEVGWFRRALIESLVDTCTVTRTEDRYQRAVRRCIRFRRF